MEFPIKPIQFEKVWIGNKNYQLKNVADIKWQNIKKWYNSWILETVTVKTEYFCTQ